MSKDFFTVQLAAGGMVSVKAKVDEGSVEQVVARRYTGAALGDRVVVRLSAARLGPAEDLAMEFLGLVPAGESEPIAKQQRRALGFASWALITHPDNAKYALALVKRIKATSRRVKSKPGHAWDEFMVMAGELNRSVKEFLPPFWEEVARIYKDLGNVTYAGRALTKALEAERVHALVVDSARRRDAVLEFALGGCLSGKALADYSKDLQNQFEPREALETLRDLTIRRTMGGMPPIASAAKDLARLAVAAGQDPDAEIETMLQRIITSPAMSRAPLQFWTSVKSNVAKIVAKDQSFAIWLLVHTDPQPSYTSDSSVWKWLELLDEWGVLKQLAVPPEQLPGDVEIPGGRAGWIGRLLCVESSPSAKLFDAIELAAPAIRAEKQPIPIVALRSYGVTWVDVDAIEVCLSLGLEVDDLPQRCQIDFDGWLRQDIDHPRRNSSLEHFLKDERFRTRTMAMIPELVKRQATKPEGKTYARSMPACRAFSEAAESHPAMRALWAEYLDGEVKLLETGGMLDAESALNRLVSCLDARTGTLFPEFTQRMAKIDMAAVLQRTLCGGVLDEYGWTALDELDDQKKIPLLTRRSSATTLQFPYVTVLRDDAIEVVSPTAHEKRTAWQRNATTEAVAILPVGGDTLVLYRDTSSSYNIKLVWMSDTRRVIETDSYYLNITGGRMLEIGAGVFYGSRVLAPGDEKLPELAPWFSDGERFWRLQENANAWGMYNDGNDTDESPSGLQEIDVQTGKRGRSSVPAWFEKDLPAGSRVMWNTCHLMPLPAGVEHTPLGSHGGLIGWRVIRRRDGRIEARGIDGRTCELQRDALQGDQVRFAVAMMDKPATKSHWIITSDHRLVDAETGIGLALLEGNKDRYRLGQPFGLPAEFYHLMTLRCEASSKLLRKTTLKQAKLLLEAGGVEHEARKVKEDPANPDPKRQAAVDATSDWLKKAPPRLVKGVARIARLAAEESISLTKLQAKLAGESTKPTTANEAKKPASDESKLQVVSQGIARLAPQSLAHSSRYFYGRHGMTTARAGHIAQVASYFAGTTPESVMNDDPNWISILMDPAAAAWRQFWIAAHTGADEEVAVPQRLNGDWLTALEFFADGGWFELPGKLAYYKGEPVDKSDAATPLAVAIRGHKTPQVKLVVEGDCRYVLYPIEGYQVNQLHAFCYATKGECKPPSTITVLETMPVEPNWKGEQVRSFVNAVRELQELPLIDSGRVAEAANRLRVSPVQVMLAYMGNFRTVHYGQEKLTKELRAHYGWKVNEIKMAVAALDATPVPLELVSLGAKLDPSGCIGARKDEAFDKVIDKWAAGLESNVSLPSEVLAQLQFIRFGYSSIDAPAVLKELANPEQSKVLKPSRVTFDFEKQGRGFNAIASRHETPEQGMLEDLFTQIDRVMWLINYSLPFGDPARRKLPKLAETILRTLDDPKTALPFGLASTAKVGRPDAIDVDATIAAFNAAGFVTTKSPEGLYALERDLVFGAMIPPAICLYFHTSQFAGDASWSQLLSAAAMTFGWEGDGTTQMRCPEFVRRMRGAEITSMMRHNSGQDMTDGAWDQDPRQSVPDLVQEVAKRLKVSDDAATLYLQTLALPDPTTKNIESWNGWKASQLKKAGDELLKGEWLVTAKRSRAGRVLFLPGGWEPLKQPNLPLETWKMKSFGYETLDRLRGGYAELVVCPRTVPDQFRHVWGRVLAGDPPRYEEASV